MSHFQHLSIPKPISPSEIQKARNGFRCFVVYLNSGDPYIERYWGDGRNYFKYVHVKGFGLTKRRRENFTRTYNRQIKSGFNLHFSLNDIANREYRVAFKKEKDAEIFLEMLRQGIIPLHGVFYK